MRIKVLLVLALAVAIAPTAFADITVYFSTPVTMVSFWSSEAADMTATTNNGVTTGPLNSGLGSGFLTSFSDTNVTSIVFSGATGSFVLDDLTYMVGGAPTGGPTAPTKLGPLSPDPQTTYTLTFDDAGLTQFTAVGSFYSGLGGGPTFSPNALILPGTTDFPSESSPNVLGTVPEPGTLVLFGSGLISLAGVLRRKLA